ncbi:MAG: ABC transporter permease [SAR202 cluster bacterium]|nr:ABC transporter permease [SAR202 cluster bacterium]
MLTRHLITRLLLFIPTLLIASILIFLIIRVLPGDVAQAVLGGSGESIHRQEQLESLRRELGLRDPLPLQYGKWLLSLVDGTFGGRSLADRQPLRTTLWDQAPITLLLILYTLALALLVSIPLGVLAAVYQDRWPDYLIRTITIAGQTLPSFVAGLLVILGLTYFLGWTPPIIYKQPWQNPIDHLTMVLWPALVLAWGLASVATRVIRAGILEALRQDYITLARIKGLSENRVLFGHALRNALGGLASVTAIQAASLLGGAVLLEVVFGLPGLGRAMASAVASRDYPVVQTLAMAFVFLVLTLNLATDILHARIDPRILPSNP